MDWTTPRVFGVVAVFVVVGVVVGLSLAPEIDCPPDYWPHQAQTNETPPQQVADLLRGIITKAVARYGAR